MLFQNHGRRNSFLSIVFHRLPLLKEDKLAVVDGLEEMSERSTTQKHSTAPLCVGSGTVERGETTKRPLLGFRPILSGKQNTGKQKGTKEEHECNLCRKTTNISYNIFPEKDSEWPSCSKDDTQLLPAWAAFSSDAAETRLALVHFCLRSALLSLIITLAPTFSFA